MHCNMWRCKKIPRAIRKDKKKEKKKDRRINHIISFTLLNLTRLPEKIVRQFRGGLGKGQQHEKLQSPLFEGEDDVWRSRKNLFPVISAGADLSHFING